MASHPVFTVSVGLVLLLGSLATFADANTFLGRLPSQNAMSALNAEAEHTLLAELEVALGSGHRHATEKRLKRVEQLISPMFGSMTKNGNGKLGPAAAGYVLHRLFVQQHGWFIRALEPEGNSLAAWNSSKPISILEERVPEHVQQLFEKRLGENGLGLKELAVLASTLEHLVHIEALQRLTVSYNAMGFSQEDVLSDEDAIDALDMYMAIYIGGTGDNNLTTMTADTARQLHANLHRFYPAYPETQAFMKETFRSVAPNRDYVYFSEVENVIAEISQRYGRFQDLQCRQIKNELVEVEDSSVGGAGRVRISDFYAGALNDGKWHFSESISYLRQSGALDESDTSNPRVIIPNYVSGPSNCVASSAYYSVCCLDECEGILGRLEEFIAAPEAPASTILALVSMIPSASMPSNRTLSPWLRQRLNEVGKHHGGVVPLHGRLFAQWLHYAYPRECSFPHATGTINPQRPRPEDLLAGPAGPLSTDNAEMKRVVAAAPARKHRLAGYEADASEESAMWSMDEELVVWRPPTEPEGAWWFSTRPMNSVSGRALALVGAGASLSITLARSLFVTLKGAQKGSSDKHYV